MEIKTRLSTQGYHFIKMPEYHRADSQGYAKVADIVAEGRLGRKLLPNEVVHHIDHDKLNDSSENLLVMDSKEHNRLHARLNHQTGAFDNSGPNNLLWKDLPKGDVIRMYLSGDSLRKIGRKFGCKHDTIKRHLIYWGVIK